MKLSGNTILITGGASGIGFELAKQLLARGNKIIITGRDQAKLERAREQLPQLQTIKSDVSLPADIKALRSRVMKSFPEMNVLINNAGIMRTINFHALAGDLADTTREIETNLMGAIRMIQQFLPHLKGCPSAAIANVTSGLAFVPLPISPVYCATKAALHSFTRSLRVQLKNTQVRVFELAPPATHTDMLNELAPEDMQGINIMKTDAMVAACLRGMEKDQIEICPGQSSQLKFMSRLAPEFILKQLSKPVERMLAGTHL